MLPWPRSWPLSARCSQSFADALIDIIDDGREALEEGDRANVSKILESANKASRQCFEHAACMLPQRCSRGTVPAGRGGCAGMHGGMYANRLQFS